MSSVQEKHTGWPVRRSYADRSDGANGVNGVNVSNGINGTNGANATNRTNRSNETNRVHEAYSGQYGQRQEEASHISRAPQRHAVIPPTSLLPAARLGHSLSRSLARPFGRLEVAQADPNESITPRQQEVLFCLAEGKPTKIICQELGMSEGTVKIHIGAIFRALRVHNRTQATLVALREGWIQPEMWSRS